jgi:hypothetical protein
MICRRIATKKRKLIRWTSYEWEKASDNISSISNMIIWSPQSLFIKEYWSLYASDDSVSKEFKQKEQKRMTWFSTKNGVIVKANSLRKSARWLSIYLWDQTLRPDCEILDDVDDDENTKSVTQIDKNFQKINSSILWGSTWQVIFLGNVIHEDWVWPRMVETFKNDPNYMIVRTRIINDDWTPQRPERFVLTDEQAEEKNKTIYEPENHIVSIESLKRKPYFMSNYMLEPIVEWEKIIDKHWIKYKRIPKHWQQLRVMSIDNAESEKVGTARIWITVCTVDMINQFIHFNYARWLEWKEKNLTNVWNVINSLYHEYDINTPILIENGWGWLSLKNYLVSEYSLPCSMFKTKMDKAQRLRTCSPYIESWAVSFELWIDPELEKELTTFPNYIYKDLMDSLTGSVLAYKDKITKKSVADSSKMSIWRSSVFNKYNNI